MKNLKLKFTHFGLLVVIALSLFTAACEDNPVEIELTCVDRENNLSGNIPSEIGNLSNLESLYLNRNNLSGNIPPELGNISLVDIFLSDNQLTGSIPSEFGNLGSLESLAVNNNQLSGCYDSNLANLCPQLPSNNISEGNNFDAPWLDFCNTGAGTCGL